MAAATVTEVLVLVLAQLVAHSPPSWMRWC